jgi:tape measure domain-containing protein
MGLSTTLKIAFDGNAVQRGLAGINKRVGDLATKMASFGAGAVVGGMAAMTAGVIAFTISSSKAAAQMEMMEASFEVLTGSAEKAKALLGEITKFSDVTPFEPQDLIQGAQTLLAFGVSLEDTMPTLKMLGDVSAGNAEKLSSLALAFGQISSSGKMSGEDLNQFINVGFNPLNQIAQRTGKSMGELRDMMSKGQITTSMVKQAFQDATGKGGMFNGMLIKMADTFEGKMSTMMGNITALKIAFGKGINEGFESGIDIMNTKLPQMIDMLKGFGGTIGKAIAEGVGGDTTRLVMIGTMIGDAIKGGIGIALANVWQDIGESAQDFANDSLGWVQREIAKTDPTLKAKLDKEDEAQESSRKFNREYLNKSMIEELAERLKGQYQQAKDMPSSIITPTAGQPQASGAIIPAADKDNKAILKEIAKNTAGGAKM